MCTGLCWASCGPEHSAASRNRLGSDSCLQRRRGRSLPCRILTRSNEPSEDVASIPPELHCLLTTYPLLGSICPGHDSLVTRGILSVPKAGDVKSSCEGGVTWDRLGGWCRLSSATKAVLSDLTRTWCPLKAGWEVFRARQTAIISWQLICRHRSWVVQEPYTGLATYKAPQPELEAFAVTTFLLEVVPNLTLDCNRREVVQGATALRQRWVILTWVRTRHQASDETQGFSQYWRGLICSRPRGMTEEAAVMRPSNLWKALRGCKVPSLKDAAARWIVREHYAIIQDRICTFAFAFESMIVPRKEARCLGNKNLLDGLIFNPKRSRCLSNNDLWAISCRFESASTSQSLS